MITVIKKIKEHNLYAKTESDIIAEPDFLMIITSVGQMAYTTNNNVLVVPIDCFKD
ncbi:MAG: hypothetical protein IJ704_04015 [Bacilli bacterium]|nr:hypothetical protein [Bacilli bacterium]